MIPALKKTVESSFNIYRTKRYLISYEIGFSMIRTVFHNNPIFIQLKWMIKSTWSNILIETNKLKYSEKIKWINQWL